MKRTFLTLRGSFAPLRLPNLRYYLTGQVISLLGTWMQVTAQSWVVWELTKSTAALGIVAMLGSLPILILGPFAGVWADRLDRRKLLIASQTAAMFLAFILAILIQTKVVQIWQIYILATLLGVVTAIDFPTQQAFIGDLSGMGEVRKAVILNAMILQISRMLGPALAGFVVRFLGPAPAFWLNGLSFLAVIVSLIVVRASQVRRPSSGNPLGEFWEGMRFIGTQPRMQDLMLSATLVTFFGISIMAVLPALAGQVLNGQAETLGLLMGASGAGALISALFIVPLAQSLRRTGLIIGFCSVWAGFGYIMLSRSTWLPISLLFIFLIGLAIPVVLVTANGLIQVMAPPNMRARLLSTFTMVSFGIQPVAALFVGFSAQRFGTQTAILINGTLLLVGALLLLVLRPAWRRWEATHQVAIATGTT